MGKTNLKNYKKVRKNLKMYYKFCGGSKDEFESVLRELVKSSISSLSMLHEQDDLFFEREEARRIKEVLDVIHCIRYSSAEEFADIVQVDLSKV